MKMEEVRTVREQLQQLDAELRKFKEELLSERVAEFERAIQKIASGPTPAGRRLVTAHFHRSGYSRR